MYKWFSRTLAFGTPEDTPSWFHGVAQRVAKTAESNINAAHSADFIFYEFHPVFQRKFVNYWDFITLVAKVIQLAQRITSRPNRA